MVLNILKQNQNLDLLKQLEDQIKEELPGTIIAILQDDEGAPPDFRERQPQLQELNAKPDIA